MYVQKKLIPVRACRLGDGSDMEKRMLSEGRLRLRDDGDYEVFTMETQGERGEIAHRGDYVKTDAEGHLWPNRQAFFEENHTRLQGDWFSQTRPVYLAWTPEEPESDAVRFLREKGLLSLHPETPERFYSASLWDTVETAARSAVLVFYAVERDDTGRVIRVDFNFVEKGVFERTYDVVPGP